MYWIVLLQFSIFYGVCEVELLYVWMNVYVYVCVCVFVFMYVYMYVEICFDESTHPLLVKFVKAHALSYHKTLQWYKMEERNGISQAV
jgi:hypothetical protein